MNKHHAKINTPYDDELTGAKALIRANIPVKIKTQDEIIKGYWNSMRSRINKGIYLEKQIKILWTYSEFHQWFISKWNTFEAIKAANETPSIDRIDSNGHYCESNCRMIPNSVNSALGEVNYLISRMKTLQTFLKDNEHWLKATQA